MIACVAIIRESTGWTFFFLVETDYVLYRIISLGSRALFGLVNEWIYRKKIEKKITLYWLIWMIGSCRLGYTLSAKKNPQWKLFSIYDLLVHFSLFIICLLLLKFCNMNSHTFLNLKIWGRFLSAGKRTRKINGKPIKTRY